MGQKEQMIEYMKGKDNVDYLVMAKDLNIKVCSITGNLAVLCKKGIVEKKGKRLYSLKPVMTFIGGEQVK